MSHDVEASTSEKPPVPQSRDEPEEEERDASASEKSIDYTQGVHRLREMPGLGPLELTRTFSTSRSVLSRVASRITNRDIVDPGPPPDGGLKAWTQVFCAWLTIVTTWGYVNSFGVFQTYYSATLTEPQSTISWIGSVQLFVIFFLSAFSGRALDAGLFIPSFALGAIVQLIGIFTQSLCTKFWQLLLAQGLCVGLGSGIVFCPALGLVTTYFSKHRGIAVAIVTSGNSAGGAIYPLIVRELLERLGYAWTVRVIGFINMTCLLLCLALMRPRLPPRKAGPVVELSAFRELPYLSTVAGFTLVFGGLFFSYYYIGSYGLTIQGMSYRQSTNLVIIFNAIGIPARLLTGFAADRLTGPLNGVIPLMFLNGVLAFTWIGVTSRPGLYVETVFYGLAAGAFQCLFPTTTTSLNADLNKNGVRLGMAFSVFSFAGLLGPPIGGALLSTNGGGKGGYVAALLGVGIATMLGTALLCVARVSKGGWRWEKC